MPTFFLLSLLRQYFTSPLLDLFLVHLILDQGVAATSRNHLPLPLSLSFLRILCQMCNRANLSFFSWAAQSKITLPPFREQFDLYFGPDLSRYPFCNMRCTKERRASSPCQRVREWNQISRPNIVIKLKLIRSSLGFEFERGLKRQSGIFRSLRECSLHRNEM